MLPVELLEQKKSFVEKIENFNRALKILFDSISNGEAEGLDLSLLQLGDSAELEQMIETIEKWSNSTKKTFPEKKERTIEDFK